MSFKPKPRRRVGRGPKIQAVEAYRWQGLERLKIGLHRPPRGMKACRVPAVYVLKKIAEDVRRAPGAQGRGLNRMPRIRPCEATWSPEVFDPEDWGEWGM